MDDFTTGFIAGQSDGNNGNANGMWGDGAWLWLIVIFAILGWGGNGFGNGFGGGNGGYLATAATQADIQRGFDTSNTFSKLEGINSGICDATYALNTSMLNGFSGVNNAVCSLGYNNAQLANDINNNIMQNRFAAQQYCCNLENAITQNRFDNQVAINGLSTQLQQCCCENRYERAKDTCAIQQSIANSTRDIVDSQNAGTRAILDYLCNEKISDLQNENQALRLAASQSNQNNALMAAMSANTAEIIRRTGNECPIPAYVVPNPNACYGNPLGVSFGNCGGSNCCNNCGGCC